MPAWRISHVCYPQYARYAVGQRIVPPSVHLVDGHLLPSMASVQWWSCRTEPSPLPADLIVAVPLHVARQRERGYNQAHLLAHGLGQMVGLPLATNTLRRTRPTRVQVGLDALERQVNVRDAFTCEARATARGSRLPLESVEGRQILLVDDVCTTGATLEACTVALRQAGAARVWGFTLAHAT